jgi:pimeloyl-ACP methyl ester carboxylesterase
MVRIAPRPLLALALALAFLASLPPPLATPVAAAGFISFEDGVDRQPIRSTIPGLRFTTTAGYDWVYGDWRTGRYNGRHPAGLYTSNGDFFAWLGPNQGAGRIDFTGATGASYLSVWVSTAEPVVITGYDEAGRQVARSPYLGPNTGTGRTAELRVEAPGRTMRYAIISGRANYWLIDDLSTDADGVPDTRVPLVVLPGIMGSELVNDDGLIWPDAWRIIRSAGDEHLGVLELAADGVTPASDERAFTSVRVGDIVRNDGRADVYAPLIRYLTAQRGYRECPDPATVCADGTLFVFPYDWRKDPRLAAARLAERIDAIRAATGATRVNLLAHSMGGLVARAYLVEPGHRARVGTLVTLGTPYLGAPKAYHGLHYAACLSPWAPVGCWLNRGMTSRLLRNFAGNYALLPPEAYFRVRPEGHVRRDFDGDGDGAADGWLSSAAISRTLRAQHNTYLTDEAAALHGAIDGYVGWPGPTRVFAVVGYGRGETPRAVREYLEGGAGGRGELRHEILRGDGDGTVPLASASMGRHGGAADLSGGVPLFYVAGEHGELPQIGSVQRLAADLFDVGAAGPAGAAQAGPGAGERPDGGSPGGVLPPVRAGAGQASASSPEQTQEPWRPIGAAPAPLSGRWLHLSGAATVTVADGAGATMTVAADGTVEGALPGVGAYRLAEATGLFLPAQGAYTVRASGGELDLRATEVARDVDRVTVVYADVALGAGATAELRVPEAGVADRPLAIDRDGDGAADAQEAPVGVLQGDAGADRAPPAATVELRGERRPQGWYAGPVEVTLRAADGEGESGVARVAYSLDGGATFLPYAGPFTVDAGAVGTLLARATDRAGNEQFPYTAARVGPERVALPLARR